MTCNVFNRATGSNRFYCQYGKIEIHSNVFVGGAVDNADHRILMPGTMLTGLIAMLICDIIAKKFLLPVNCITALLGVPVILWVIGKNLRIFK